MEILQYIQRFKTGVSPVTFSSVLSRHYCAISSKEKEQPNASVDTPLIKQETIDKIEKLSLLNFKGDYGLSVLKGAIDFTHCLQTANIDETVEPMYSPSEKILLRLRDDKVQTNVQRHIILRNATVVEEEYFVAPFRNIRKS